MNENKSFQVREKERRRERDRRREEKKNSCYSYFCVYIIHEGLRINRSEPKLSYRWNFGKFDIREHFFLANFHLKFINNKLRWIEPYISNYIYIRKRINSMIRIFFGAICRIRHRHSILKPSNSLKKLNLWRFKYVSTAAKIDRCITKKIIFHLWDKEMN